MSKHSESLKIINKIKDQLKKDPIVKDLFEKYDCDVNEIDDIPICFDPDLDVSARTDHAIIYLNGDLLDRPKEIDHYLVHEITHFLQQTHGDGPTKGSTDDTYLDNKYEQSGFKNQTKYLSETRGDDVAKNYITEVMDHHEVPKNERNEKREELLELANTYFNLIK